MTRHVDGREIVEVPDRAAWRQWLAERHEQGDAIWLVFHKKASDGTSPTYEEAVEEALCFGWIDSTVNRLDDRRSLQLFAPRRPRGTWSASNKERVARLERAGLLAPAGIAAIAVAKDNGSWNALDAVERLQEPPDLAAALEAGGHGPRELERLQPVIAQGDPLVDREREAAGDARAADRADGPHGGAGGARAVRSRIAATRIEEMRGRRCTSSTHGSAVKSCAFRARSQGPSSQRMRSGSIPRASARSHAST